MASRLITDEIAKSNKLPQLSPDALNLFFLLLPHFSVHGKSLGDPHYIKGKVCSKFKRFTPDKVSKCLKEISEKTNVKWFKVDNIYYLHSLNYSDHQPGLRRDRSGKDLLPDFLEVVSQPIEKIELPDKSGQLPEQSTHGSRMLDVGSRIEEVGCEMLDVGYVEQIIIYLNDKLSTEYKASSKKTQDLIKARISQGFTVEDFKTVIDKKAVAWMRDPKMSPFLRPETLFGTKFEAYLNEKTGPVIKGTDKTAGNWALLEERKKGGFYETE